MDIVEKMASEIAEKLNGGEWKDGKWYADSHRKAWMDAVKPYAQEIERLREALNNILHVKYYGEEGGYLESDSMRDIARSALQQKDSE